VTADVVEDFPIFPLPIVLLPTEIVPLHIFEERYKTMIGECIDADHEFGIVWLADDGLKSIGCTARVSEVLERMEDGRMNLLVQGTTPFKLLEKQENHEYPAATIELLDDPTEEVEDEAGDEARESFANLVERVTDMRPEDSKLESLGAYEMAASVEIALELKQGLLEQRSEETRLRMLSKLFEQAMERIEVAERIAEQARTNGKVRFGT
jgi:Lon protease-like protein